MAILRWLREFARDFLSDSLAHLIFGRRGNSRNAPQEPSATSEETRRRVKPTSRLTEAGAGFLSDLLASRKHEKLGVLLEDEEFGLPLAHFLSLLSLEDKVLIREMDESGTLNIPFLKRYLEGFDASNISAFGRDRANFIMNQLEELPVIPDNRSLPDKVADALGLPELTEKEKQELEREKLLREQAHRQWMEALERHA